MTVLRASATAWALFVGGMALQVSVAVADIRSAGTMTAAASVVTLGIGVTATGGVGLLLALRRPMNPFGWLFLWALLYSGTIGAIAEYARWSSGQQPPGYASVVATWMTNWSWVPLIGALALYPLMLFPSGALPGPGWRWLPRSGAVVIALWTASFALESSQYTDASGVVTGANPYAPGFGRSVFDTLPLVLSLAFLALVVAAAVSMVVRFRRGDAATRAQLKWFLLAGAVWLCVLLYPGDHGTGQLIDVAMGLAVALVPVTMAVAILRYRLYEIDRIISRTTSYALVSAVVVSTYALVVTAVSALSPGSSSLGVAAATLAAAAVVRPLLRRVQAAVDRRFNRAGFDAAQTVDSFGARLRQQVDVDEITDELVRAVARTLQPASLSVWRTDPS